MCQYIKIILFIASLDHASCTVGGLSYRDDLILDPSRRRTPPEDPCHPLYWYPKEIPEHCYRTLPPPMSPPQPIPMPPAPPIIPPSPPPLVPLPPPIPMPPPMPMPPNMLLPPPGPYPMPPPFPAPMLMPVPPFPAPYPAPAPVYPYPPQTGLVPGIPGLVSPEGGVNVLPFSDAYADLLEKHKQKMIRIRLQKLLDKYDGYPKRYYRRRKYRRKYLE